MTNRKKEQSNNMNLSSRYFINFQNIQIFVDRHNKNISQTSAVINQDGHISNTHQKRFGLEQIHRCGQLSI